jgi:hypothetical protein
MTHDSLPHTTRPATRRVRVGAVIAAAGALLAVHAPATAAGATWNPVHDATRTGQAFSPVAAADAAGSLAIGFIRQRGEDDYRAEVRRGLLERGLQGGSLVLDESADDLSSIAVTQTAGGGLAASWLRHADRAQGPRATTVSADGAVAAPVNLVPDGTESAFDPRWVAREGGAPLLVWDRRTTSASAPLDGRGFGAPSPLPGVGLASSVSVVERAGGERVAVWSDATRVLTARAPAGGPFGATTQISGAGVARDPQLALGADGTAMAAWVRNTGAGNVLEVTSAPPGGSFGPTTVLSAPEEGAFAPRLVATGDEDGAAIVAVWVSGPTDRGWGSVRGPLRLRRLTGEGEPIGDPLTITPPGIRTADPALAGDGRGAVFIGWSSGLLAARQIGVRRLGRTGRLGAAREIAAGRWEMTGAPVLAAADGLAVMVWSADGIVRYRLYH